MKHIVVPTDFSPCALSALKVAAGLAKKSGASISLVHTYALPVYGFTSGHLMYDGVALNKITDEINDELTAIAGMDVIKDLNVNKLLLSDINIEQMFDHDDLQDVDLVVMGSHGTSGLKRELLGSNAERLIRHAKCPVICVREDHGDSFEINDMVFASSFYGEVEDHFTMIKSYADLFDARLHLLYVNTPDRFQSTSTSMKIMQNFANKFALKGATLNIYNEFTIEDGVIRFSEEIGADMIAMETHGRTGISHLFMGSITEDVANHTTLPLLSVKIIPPFRPVGVIFPDMR